MSDGSAPQQTASRAFNLTVAPALTAITVTPASPTILTGGAQQFAATGTYSDGSTQNVTSQVTWSSSKTAVGTINASGLATAISAGSTTISATLGLASGGTLLAVIVPLGITTTSLPSALTNVSYSAALAASGGTTPYTWSIVSGSLPAGLVLNSSSGAITGVPTAAGTFNFIAQASDAGSPAQTAIGLLSITITAVFTAPIPPATNAAIPSANTLQRSCWRRG